MRGQLRLGDYRQDPPPQMAWIVTDPPYNVGFGYPAYNDRQGASGYQELFKPLVGYRAIVINYAEQMIRYVVPVLGFPQRCVTWVYNSNLPRQSRMIAWFNCEPDFSQVLQPYKNPNDKRIKKLIAGGSKGRPIYDWWHIEQVKNTSSEKQPYVNQIPEEVVERILLTTIPPGECVWDPFCGSGTVPAVANRLGYNWGAHDISEEALSITRERLEAAS